MKWGLLNKATFYISLNFSEKYMNDKTKQDITEHNHKYIKYAVSMIMYGKFNIEDFIRNMFSWSNMDYCLYVTSEGVYEYVY